MNWPVVLWFSAVAFEGDPVPPPMALAFWIVSAVWPAVWLWLVPWQWLWQPCCTWKIACHV